MKDIVEQLVDPNRCNATCSIMRLEAADEITRLRMLVEALQADRQTAANELD